MIGRTGIIFLLLSGILGALGAQPENNRQAMAGSAFLENASYRLLEQICDRAGGRLIGTAKNEKAMQMLSAALEAQGWNPRPERFTVPGWTRGADEVVMLRPTERRFKAVALGYVDKTPAFEAPVVYAGYGFAAGYDTVDAANRVVLVTSERPKGEEILRSEAIEIAAQHGAKAILFINTKPGAVNLAGTGNFQGNPTAIPAYSLTLEEGQWLRRLLAHSEPVKMRITTRSFCHPIESANLVLTLPGKSPEKIVAGAHFDSWDLGQGAIDNGLGTAILFDAARLIYRFSPQNEYTIEFVWFNGEELGLWGSKKYLEMHSDDHILAMVNMDMTGVPTGFNAMGFDEFIPFLEKLRTGLNGFDLSRGVISHPWTNSDHQPFMLAGIPTLSLLAHLDDEMVKYYHSMGDTFDKVNKKYLSESAAVVSLLIAELANNRELKFRHKSAAQVVEMLQEFHLDTRLRKQKEWHFSNE